MRPKADLAARSETKIANLRSGFVLHVVVDSIERSQCARPQELWAHNDEKLADWNIAHAAIGWSCIEKQIADSDIQLDGVEE